MSYFFKIAQKGRFSLILNSLRVSICLMILGTLVFCSFFEGRVQQITASGDIAMEKLRVPTEHYK